MKTNNLTLLSKKGEVTILERPKGSAVAIQAGGNIVTLEGGSKDQLIAELLQIVKNWPNIN